VKKNMACFTVPMTLAIVIGAIRKKIPTTYHINWLLTLLGGGVVALIVEHIAHGEVVLYPPFFTAMKSPADTAVMLHEMATIGVAMTVVCVAVWVSMVVYVSRMETAKSKHHRTTV
jgi:lipoprotein signal peptidase